MPAPELVNVPSGVSELNVPAGVSELNVSAGVSELNVPEGVSERPRGLTGNARLRRPKPSAPKMSGIINAR